MAFIILLHQGLRRGELLLLPMDAVKSEFDRKLGRVRYWLNIETNAERESIDKRHNKPSIKTAHSIRQIPVTEFTANLIQTYTENFRGKPDHPFLLNSQWNTPVSHESLTDYFKQISAHLPPPIRDILKNRTTKTSISPHDLRHTCAVVRLSQLIKQGDSMDVALPKLRAFFGWARDSDMPMRYASAEFEDQLAGLWTNVFDDRVSILRAIPEGR